MAPPRARPGMAVRAGPLLRDWRRGFDGGGDARVGYGRSGRLDDRSPDAVQVHPDGRRNPVRWRELGGLAEVVHPGQLKVVLRLEGSIEYRKQVRQREGPVVEGDLRIAQHDECAQPIEELII